MLVLCRIFGRLPYLAFWGNGILIYWCYWRIESFRGPGNSILFAILATEQANVVRWYFGLCKLYLPKVSSGKNRTGYSSFAVTSTGHSITWNRIWSKRSCPWRVFTLGLSRHSRESSVTLSVPRHSSSAKACRSSSTTDANALGAPTPLGNGTLLRMLYFLTWRDGGMNEVGDSSSAVCSSHMFCGQTTGIFSRTIRNIWNR